MSDAARPTVRSEWGQLRFTLDGRDYDLDLYTVNDIYNEEIEPFAGGKLTTREFAPHCVNAVAAAIGCDPGQLSYTAALMVRRMILDAMDAAKKNLAAAATPSCPPPTASASSDSPAPSN